MFTPLLRRLASAVFTILYASLLVLAAPVQKHEKIDLTKIPGNVLSALKSKFPTAEIHKWSKEQEGDIVVYDFEFKYEGQKFEADIKEDGSIHNWEKEVTFESLPDVVKQVVRQKYPKAPVKEVMQITAVKNGKDELEGYEIVLETAAKKHVEITLAPDGKILEESDDND